MPISLVCFDLGGVLVRLVTGWEHASQVAGVTWPAAPDSWQEGWKRHHDLAQALEIGAYDQPAYESAVRECFPGIDCSNYWRVFDAWLQGLYPGVPQLIDDLHARGLKTAVLSNTNLRHWHALRNGDYAPLNKIHHLVASHEIRARKPDLAAYRHVEQLAGVSPDRILFFDDKPENVAAAHAAGWHADPIDPAREGVPQIRENLRRRGLL